MQARSLQLVKLALLHVVIIHCHQQQQTVGVYTHTHTHTHTIPFPTCLDLQRYGFNGFQKGPQIYIVNIIISGCPGNFEGCVSQTSVSGSLDSGESQGGVGMG